LEIFPQSLLVVESERPARRNHKDNTRSFRYGQRPERTLRSGSPRTDKVACEENKTPYRRFPNSARLEKETQIAWEKAENRGRNRHETLIFVRLSIIG
jgi:hypothetical protein